jgi:hypothetical protein
MTAGELVVVLAALLCAIGFAARGVLLVRVLDTLRDLVRPGERPILRACGLTATRRTALFIFSTRTSGASSVSLRDL